MSGEGDVKRLSGRDGFRLRIGRYRVIFEEDASTILAICIGRRETTTYSRN
jgi:mRNA interferase RelE/StbE